MLSSKGGSCLLSGQHCQRSLDCRLLLPLMLAGIQLMGHNRCVEQHAHEGGIKQAAQLRAYLQVVITVMNYYPATGDPPKPSRPKQPAVGEGRHRCCCYSDCAGTEGERSTNQKPNLRKASLATKYGHQGATCNPCPRGPGLPGQQIPQECLASIKGLRATHWRETPKTSKGCVQPVPGEKSTVITWLLDPTHAW